MIDSVSLTRKGWIRHLELVQGMLGKVSEILRNVQASFTTAACENTRSEKISKDLVKVKELVWETCAVSGLLDKEAGADAPDVLSYERDLYDADAEGRRKALHKAAKDLEALARWIYDPEAAEIVEPEVVYPGAMGAAPAADPNQRMLDLRPPEPPQVDPGSLLDYKSRQANDDTREDVEEDGDGDE